MLVECQASMGVEEEAELEAEWGLVELELEDYHRRRNHEELQQRLQPRQRRHSDFSTLSDG